MPMLVKSRANLTASKFDSKVGTLKIACLALMFTGTVTLVQTLAAEATPRRARRANEDMVKVNERRERWWANLLL